MKKSVLAVLILSLSLSLVGCANTGEKSAQPPPQAESPQAAENEQAAVAKLVERFGQKLKSVSLLAPEDIVKQSLQEHYGDLVSPELLAKWQANPQHAPGRLTSSPWPERIETQSIARTSADRYEVQGEVIEITSVEATQGGAAARRPITLVIEQTGGRWLITAVTLGQYEQVDAIMYQNADYGFRFSLPASWQGYEILSGQWEGAAVGDGADGKPVATGPLISIRHPRWTSQNQRQDIPIMVFTVAQWDSMQAGDFHIGAAPIGPSELGRNAKYVFALPARYNYAFPPGFEEVERILAGNPLQATENVK
ncbi:MAG TPA: hypothetical protein VD902_08115 [Symbiobacteriaceae bacterium]|nr:hypothetical protein [Symbiobacteriaceae bacterium]